MAAGCGNDDTPGTPPVLFQLKSVRVGTYDLHLTRFDENTEAPINQPIVISFSVPIDKATAEQAISLQSDGAAVEVDFSYLDSDATISLGAASLLEVNKSYTLHITDQIRGTGAETFPGVEVIFTTAPEELKLESLTVAGQPAGGTSRLIDLPLIPVFEITFANPLQATTINADNIKILGGPGDTPLSLVLNEEKTGVTVAPQQPLKGFRKYTLWLSGNITGELFEEFSEYSRTFYTSYDPAPVMPEIGDEELLDLVQEKTFQYFYDFAHPASGMARERNTSGSTVTTGGTGFGLMAIIVGIERGFITRQQGIAHFEKIIGFLETADRFHGVWPHWLNGDTGSVQPFSQKDNGADLVETSFLVQGLLTLRQYLADDVTAESSLKARINALWEAVEWDWHTKGGEKVLYWHWSPNYEWEMNLPIRGYNEALITYFLAAASPSHAIDAAVYHEGWARNGAIKSGKTFYETMLPLGYDYGGPLFFSHYSFLGLDPTGLSDTYANYWEQNVAHSLINQAYCADNPRSFAGYNAFSWGLTASDNHEGYSAHSPTNDKGVITPTAALSSMPYTPEQSMAALRFFYYQLGDRLFGEYGFYDAFNITEQWTASSYLAIDQGPIVVMIENYRTGLLWDLFMSAPEVQTGLDKLGFTSER